MDSAPKKPTSPCGGCTACCSLFEVQGIPGYEEETKPALTPCRWLHSPESGYSGCSIYKDRPLACQQFECHYLKLARRFDLDTPTSLRPDISGVVIVHMVSRIHFLVYVTSEDPDAWKKPEVLAALKPLLQDRFKVVITWGKDKDYLLLESDGAGGYMESTLPHKEGEEVRA